MSRVRVLALLIAVLALAGCGGHPKADGGPRKIYVNFPSMEPTFVKGDVVVLHPVPATITDGMIVVFKDPGGWLGTVKDGELMKRVVGVGGEHVKCCNPHGQITINGVALDESAHLPPNTVPSDRPFDVHVPAGHLWLLGDNRGNSYDSRARLVDPGHGFVSTDLVVGVVREDGK